MATPIIEKEAHTQEVCQVRLRAIQDALNVLDGKWKLPIMLSVMFGTKRFKQIAKDIPGITDKMLSKELKDLEMNQMVKRKVYDTFPPTVEYAMTDYGHTLENIIAELCNWGMQHRKQIMRKKEVAL